MCALKTTPVTAELYDYLTAHSLPPDDAQRRLMERTARLGPVARMQIGPDEGAFLTLLTRLIGARQAIEIGTFTGYSSLCIARGLAPGGQLLCCDVDEEWGRIAREAWEQAGVADRIRLRLGPALDTLRALAPDPVFDLAFIDADKENYIAYYEELLPRMRPGGAVLADNVLWRGHVVDPVDDTPPEELSATRRARDADTRAIREFNAHVAADGRVEAVILSIGDGVTLIRRRD
ncbi:class I SAM-dependent methyltransferase [Actinomadura sp. NPDC048032]|uniref:O-methyltransferase n=1 Tax=Actinomadura sp. NPDC048032 TaxID=3155747 RepID=UPI0033D3AC55